MDRHAGWLRNRLTERGIEPCIALIRGRKAPIPYDKVLYRQQHRMEDTFARLKDWRRIATGNDRCAHFFFSAICNAAAVTFWLAQSGPPDIRGRRMGGPLWVRLGPR